MQLHWHIDTTASALHAAAAAASGRRLADRRVVAEAEAALSRLSAALAPANVSTADFLHAAIPLSPRHVATGGLVRAALSSLGQDDGDPPLFSMLAAAIDELTHSILHVLPNMGEQLALRMVPLREAWDARGPGLWKALRKTAGDGLGRATLLRSHASLTLGGSAGASPSHFETELRSPPMCCACNRYWGVAAMRLPRSER